MGNKPGSQAGGAGGGGDGRRPPGALVATSRTASGSSLGEAAAGRDDSQIASTSSGEHASPTASEVSALPRPIDSVDAIDFKVELCGGKGWPTNAHVIYYHAPLGLAVVGTEGGVMLAYGDGFQYMRPLCALSDDGAIFEVSHIVALTDDRIAVALGNNSIHVLSLPLLDVVASLPAEWLSKRYGDISTISFDATNRRPYIYVGTSEGFVRVLEVSSFIRVCEFNLSLADAGLTGNLLVSSIQVSPKNDRYVAVGYDGDSSTLGAVAIFDLTKRKPHRLYKLDAITSVAWNHTGDLLFAGTRTGEIVTLGFEKQYSSTAWRCESQLVSPDGSEGHLMIRSIRWMPPTVESTSEAGCLFVLIGSFGVDAENLRSVIVALSASDQNGSLQEILTVPPVHGEEVTSFLLASSWDRTAGDASKVVPCLLLLTETSVDGSDESIRHLKFLRCPETPMSQWMLEISLSSAPRRAIEVLPGLTAVTAIAGLAPSASTSDTLSTATLRESTVAPNTNILLRGPQSPAAIPNSAGSGPAKRRVSQRDFFKDIPGFDEEMTDSWELVMGTGARDVVEALDIIILGHEDGSVVVWGVARSPAECTGLSGSSSGTSWIPLRALRLSHAAVTSVAHNTAAGLMAAGDSEGNVVVWETSSAELSGSSGETLNQKVSLRFPDAVTSIALTASSIFVGTKSGRVLFANFSAPAATAINTLSRLGGILGSVAHMVIAPYWTPACAYSNMSALYVCYSNGYLAIVNAETKELCGFTKSNAPTSTQVEVSEGDSGVPSCLKFDNTGRGYYPVCFAGVFTSAFEPAPDTIKDPEKEAEQDIDSDDSDEPVPEPAPAPAAAAKKDGDNKIVLPSVWIARKIKGSSSSDAQKNAAQAIPMPKDAPKYFVRVCNKTVVLFDLSKISVPPTPKKSDFIEAQNGIAKIVYNFDESIVGASLVCYVEDAARFWSSPFYTLSCVDLNSSMYDLAFTSKDLRALCNINLLQDKLSSEVELCSSIVLPNGRVYMQQTGVMIFSATPYDTKYVPIQTLPARCRTQCIAPASGSLGASSPEVSTAMKRKTTRMSIIGLGTGAPAELEKLFAKTYDQLQKDDLLYRESTKVEEEESEDIQKHQIAQAIKASSALKSNVMDETRQAFEERGRRLQELSEKTAKLSLTAAEYRAHTSAQKERLRKKAQRWGLF